MVSSLTDGVPSAENQHDNDENMIVAEGELVEAAGIEPLLPSNPNPMMVHDFGFYRKRIGELPRRCLSPRVPSSPLEFSPVLEIFWRRSARLCPELII